MKNKIILKAVLLLMLVGLYIPAVYCQNPAYTCKLANDARTGNTVLEFDVYLLRTGATPFELAQIQFGFLYNDSIKDGGTLTASWVPGSVDPAIVASGQENISFNTAIAGLIKIAAKLPTGGAGTGAIISNVEPGTRIGRLRLTNSIPFANGTRANITWCFNSLQYPSKVFAYVGGINTDITSQSCHLNELSNISLPVELTSFESKVQGRNILLSWETKTEINSQKFEIERQMTKDNTSTEWQKVTEVKAAGTSTTALKYSYMDKGLNTGKFSYRLKVMDLNGTFRYSNIIETEIIGPKEYAISQNYPNPFNPSTKIEYQLPYDSDVNIDLYSITGQKVATIVNANQALGYYTVSVNAGSLGLSSGVYIYRINASTADNKSAFVQVKKMMLLK